MYNYGSQFFMICLAFVLVVPVTSKLYLPVFMELRLTSSYEYLKLRFNKFTSLLAGGLYILQMVLYTNVAVYAPALALSQVTQLNVYLAVAVVYAVCIFYASQGGMKAVIIADTFQAIILVTSLVLILYMAEKLVGGMGVIWSENYKTDRLEIFNIDPNPMVRHSFWTVVVGGTFYWMTMFCSNQASIQKYLSVKTITQANRALWVSCIGLILIYTINFSMGMVLVTYYHNCDPLQSGKITASDEILPLYVISELGHISGVTGFFVAGMLAASLGTVACTLNSLAAVTYKDFIIGIFNMNIPEAKEALWTKWITVFYGVVSFGLVFLVEQLGSVMQIALSFNGMVGGVTLGLFSLGMFFPWTNSKGAITGGIFALVLVIWMGIGQHAAVAHGIYVIQQKSVSIENCTCLNLNNTVHNMVTKGNTDNSEIFFLYRISYLWYSAIGCFVTIIVAMIVSAFTGFQNVYLDSKLLAPAVRDFYNSLPNHIKQFIGIEVKQAPSSDINLKGVINMEDETQMKISAEKKNKDASIINV